MAKELMEIGGFITSGAEIVNHDTSLSGNGTVDSPLGLNETVLWSGDGAITGTLSEAVSSFNTIKIYGYEKDSNQYTFVHECYPTTANVCYCSINYTWNNGTNIYTFYEQIRVSGNQFSGLNGGYWRVPFNNLSTATTINTYSNNEAIKITKVVGINRKA